MSAPSNQPDTSFSGHTYVMSARLDEVSNMRDEFCRFLREHTLSDENIYSWTLVFTEAVVNAIRHGCGSNPDLLVTLHWMAKGTDIKLMVEDPGEGPNEALTVDPVLPKDPLAESGRGLFLIRQFADSWEHWRSREGYRLVVIKRHPDMHSLSGVSQLLDNTLEELSNAYENLSAFYRLGDGLARAESLQGFISQAFGELQRAVSKVECSVAFYPALIEALGLDEAADNSLFGLVSDLGEIQKRVLRKDTDFIWERTAEVTGDSQLAHYPCGLCFPIQAGGSTRGVITVTRRERRPFNAGELNTVRTFTDIVGIAVLNARNTIARSKEARALRELEIAAEIQKTLLPLPQTIPNDRWRLVTRREGAREVAGDYVGAAQTRNGDLHLVIIDVMGKGVSASFLAGMFRTAFNICLTFQYSPVGLMMALNRTLVEQLGDLTMFTTCTIARIPASLDCIEVVNAGHCPAVLVQSTGALTEITSSGPPLGLFPEAEYKSQVLSCQTGDKLFLVTDGLYEWHEAGNSWGWESLRNFLQAHRRLSGEAIWDDLTATIAQRAEGLEASDDRTFLCWERLA